MASEQKHRIRYQPSIRVVVTPPAREKGTPGILALLEGNNCLFILYAIRDTPNSMGICIVQAGAEDIIGEFRYGPCNVSTSCLAEYYTARTVI